MSEAEDVVGNATLTLTLELFPELMYALPEPPPLARVTAVGASGMVSTLVVLAKAALVQLDRVL